MEEWTNRTFPDRYNPVIRGVGREELQECGCLWRVFRRADVGDAEEDGKNDDIPDGALNELEWEKAFKLLDEDESETITQHEVDTACVRRR